jgi:tetratricopeptide (TPR) repeat protein
MRKTLTTCMIGLGGLLTLAGGIAAQDLPATPPTSGGVQSVDTNDDAQRQIAAGLTAFRRRRFHEAEKAFEAAVAADPRSAAARYYLGYTVYKIAEPLHANSPGKHRAAQLFAEAYQLDPTFRPVWAGR